MLTDPTYLTLQLPRGFRAVFLDALSLLCPSLEQANTHVFLTDVYGMFCSTLSNLQVA